MKFLKRTLPIKKLIVGLAVLAVSVTGMRAGETGKIRTVGLNEEPDVYLVRLDSKSDGNKGVYTVEAENRDVESTTRIQYSGEIEDLHTLKIPMGMVNLSQIDINTSGLREIYLSHDTCLDRLAGTSRFPVWNGYSFDIPSYVLTITTSADTPAMDTNWNQIYLFRPNQYNDGYQEPLPIKFDRWNTHICSRMVKEQNKALWRRRRA